MKDATDSADLFRRRFIQLDLERDNGPRRGVDNHSAHFADRLSIGRNNRAPSKLLIRNLHFRTTFPGNERLNLRWLR